MYVKTFITSFQRWRGKDYPGKKSSDDAICKYQTNSKNDIWTYCASTRTPLASINMTRVWPIFCLPKQQGQGLRIVQDFREVNQNSHVDKYSMKEITECIGDIGRADLTIFTKLDLNSGFWQMQLDEDSQKLTAFTIPGKGQFHWITTPMWLLGCPASFQWLMEGVHRDILNVLVYIDDLLVHTDTHERHLQVLDQVLARLHNNHLKINLEKCVFGNNLSPIWDSLLHWKGSNPARINWRLSRMPNHPRISKQFGLSSAYATFSGCTPKTLRSSQLLYSS